MSSFVFCRVFIVFGGFWTSLRNHCNSLHKTKSRLVIAIWQGSWTSRTKNCFISRKFESAAIVSAPAQEGNLLFLSALSARKKLHSFPSKSNHLCRILGPIWLSSQACDRLCASKFAFEIRDLASATNDTYPCTGKNGQLTMLLSPRSRVQVRYYNDQTQLPNSNLKSGNERLQREM